MTFTPNETQLNLMRAFAGESQARNRYTIAAAQAKEKELYVLEQVFLYTAEQERAHAAVFYDLLQEAAGQTIHIDGGFPIDIDPTLTGLLQMAQHNETAEADDVYPAFAAQADKDGYARAANAFRMIAKVEAVHADRFRQFESWLSGDTLFSDTSDSCVWMCQNCGHIHVGKNAPGMCPVCLYKQGYFLRADMAAYTAGTILRQNIMA
ncbi:MAG: rubrerythrin family protein [Clostridia bacterium]|nr:rubrerythrin family protein [Clostridia bacterium]